MIAGLVPVVLVAAVLYWHQARRGNPDPGGRILTALVPVSAAVPSDATIVFNHEADGAWDSCDGLPQTAGWHDITYEIRFTSQTDPQAVVTDASRQLADLGWGASSIGAIPGIGAQWSKRVEGSPGPAIVTLARDPGEVVWILTAHAPPATHPLTGC